MEKESETEVPERRDPDEQIKVAHFRPGNSGDQQF